MFLHFLQGHFQCLARDLALVAARPHLGEHLHPGFVAGLQLLGVEFQRRQEFAVLAELVVHLRPLLQQFVNDRLVLHGGSPWG